MPVLDVEQRGAVHGIRRPFPLQFEDDHAAAEDARQVSRDRSTPTSCEAAQKASKRELTSGASREEKRQACHLSWPAASRLTSECAARIQNRSCSRRKVCTPVRLDMSQTRMLLSSEFDTMMSCKETNEREYQSMLGSLFFTVASPRHFY